jgi:cell division protein FtsL
MSRRKSELKPKTVITTIAVVATLCVAGLGYIWLKSELYKLGKQVKGLEIKLDELRHTNEGLKREYAVLCTPKEWEERAKRLKLGLIMPPTDQIVRLPEPEVVAGGTVEKTKIYASRER